MSKELNAANCDLVLIDAFLSEKLGTEDERLLMQHLDGCPDCRKRMESQAAEHDTWDNAEKFLQDEDNDSILLSSDADSGPGLAAGSVQINSVLGANW